MITILDYGAGNVRSVINSVKSLGHEIKIVEKPQDIKDASRLIFPGVGSYGSMVDVLNKREYMAPLKEYLQNDRPFLGICLGMQVLLENSEESPGYEGLGFFKGSVKRFNLDISVPHMGWNGIIPLQESLLFNNLNGEEKLYFVHSYYAAPVNKKDILTYTDYGIRFASSLTRGNITGTQFHPEKSGKSGLKVLKNFVEGTGKKVFPVKRNERTALAKRVIACLDVRSNDEGDLVVTKGDQYDVRDKGEVRNLGAPVDLAKRYYNEGADEITFLNITGFRDFPLKDTPMLEVLKRASKEIFVPLTIGGGIRNYTDENGKKYTALEVAAEYFRSGADKISIGSDAVFAASAFIKSGEKTEKTPIEEISKVYGSQAVIISIDPRKVFVKSKSDKTNHTILKSETLGPDGEEFCYYECTINGGREGSDIDAVALAKAVEALGAGEILLNSIDKDGSNSGFDTILIKAVKDAVTIPVIASSGAGKVEDFSEVFKKTNADAALAAGIFHRQEVPIQKVKEHLKNHEEIRMD